ncbi:MAG: molybdopterin-guanine dinucleotide biosynthesis protein B [Paenibacillaceae bacterium]
MAHVIGFVGRSNSGKTTLITQLIIILRSRGLRVGVIKHDAHGHYKAVKHTDSSRYMDSGAEAVVLSGKAQVVRFEAPQVEPSLDQLLAGMPELDIILVEGYKKSDHPKIAVFLTSEQITVLDELQGDLLAVVSGCSYQHKDLTVPIYEINDSLGVAEFICDWMKKSV